MESICTSRLDASLRKHVGQEAFENVLANYTLDLTLFDYLAAFCRIASREEAMMDGKLPFPRYVEL